MSAIVKKVGNKYAKSYVEQQGKAWEPSDTLYETYTDANGVQRRKKRDMPPGLTKKQAKVLKKLRSRSHYLDKGFSLCGFRFGWGAIFGLIPGAGDVFNLALGYLLILRPAKKGLEPPTAVYSHMVFNSAVATGIGVIPLAGDVLVAVWKPNSRNVHLIEEWLIASVGADGKIHIPNPEAGATAGPSTSSTTTGAAGKQVVEAHKNRRFSLKDGGFAGWKTSKKGKVAEDVERDAAVADRDGSVAGTVGTAGTAVGSTSGTGTNTQKARAGAVV